MFSLIQELCEKYETKLMSVSSFKKPFFLSWLLILVTFALWLIVIEFDEYYHFVPAGTGMLPMFIFMIPSTISLLMTSQHVLENSKNIFLKYFIRFCFLTAHILTIYFIFTIGSLFYVCFRDIACLQ